MRKSRIYQGLLVTILIVCLTGCFTAPASNPHVNDEASPSASSTISMSSYMLESTDEPLHNPFIGWAPLATQRDSDGYPHTLVYAPIPWNIVEPLEGIYDFVSLKTYIHYDYWKSRGVRLILRPLLDYPSSDEDEPEMPAWLIDKLESTDQSGVFYDNGYGKGYSPAYDNPILIEQHEKLLSRLGQEFNYDPYIAFIQLGSIGHWGEWHVNYGDGIPRMPVSAVTDIYVEHYMNAFPDKKLLMRRPFPIALENGLGLFNDSFIRYSDQFIDWVENGYLSDQTLEEFPGMPNFWQTAPSGGEFGTSALSESLKDAQKALDYIRREHISFLGPRCPDEELEDEQQRKNELLMRNALGYRLQVREVQMPKDPLNSGNFPVVITFENTGVAPFYYQWPIEIMICNNRGVAVASCRTSWDIREILPGEKVFSEVLQLDHVLEGDYILKLAVIDPFTGTPGVALANSGRDSSGSYELCRFLIRAAQK